MNLKGLIVVAVVAICFCTGAMAAVETYKEEFDSIGLGDCVWVQGPTGYYTGTGKAGTWTVESGSLHYVKTAVSPTNWSTYPIGNIDEGFSWTSAIPIQLLPVAYTIHITDLSGWLAAPGLRLTVGTQAFEQGGGAIDYPLFEFTTSSVKVYCFSSGATAEVDLTTATTLDLTFSYEVGQIKTLITVDGGTPTETLFPDENCVAGDTYWFYFYVDNQGAWADGASHGPQTADFKIDALSITTDPTLTTRNGGGEVVIFPDCVTTGEPVEGEGEGEEGEGEGEAPVLPPYSGMGEVCADTDLTTFDGTDNLWFLNGSGTESWSGNPDTAVVTADGVVFSTTAGGHTYCLTGRGPNTAFFRKVMPGTTIQFTIDNMIADHNGLGHYLFLAMATEEGGSTWRGGESIGLSYDSSDQFWVGNFGNGIWSSGPVVMDSETCMVKVETTATGYKTYFSFDDGASWATAPGLDSEIPWLEPDSVASGIVLALWAGNYGSDPFRVTVRDISVCGDIMSLPREVVEHMLPVATVLGLSIAGALVLAGGIAATRRKKQS